MNTFLLRLFTAIVFASVFSQVCTQELGHAETGTYYEKEGVKAYAVNRHGPDGAIFLDPYFTPYLLNLENKQVLDAGCGAAPWSIFAAENGAQVFAIDLQKEMIDLAASSAQEAGVLEKITFAVGDVAQLPCNEHSFDLSLSINVGCNLPSTIQLGEKLVGLGPHISEMARILKKGGTAIVTAPASFGTLFTDGTPQEEVLEHIANVLQRLKSDSTPAEVVSHLNELKEVYRATFALRNGKVFLVTNENEIIPGEEIWRKLPGLTVPNRYHPESEYLEAFAKAGLKVQEHHRPHFSDEVEWAKNKNLGMEYVSHHPFVIFCVVKETE